MSRTDAVIAVQRFGLGARPGDLQLIGNDPRGWLVAQLGPVPQPPAAFRDMPTAAERFVAFREMQQARRAAKQIGGATAIMAPDKAQADKIQADKIQADKALGENLRETYKTDAAARCQTAIDSDTPFQERLVQFWSNHFTVSGQRPPLLALAAPYENEAIRPHVLGRFADLLLAVIRHPAMLIYLDNAESVGPMSRVGAQRARGLNENLARELMELHTLGVNGGYSQTDVRELAKILTGWTVTGPAKPGMARPGQMQPQQPGSFRFAPGAHEPGEKTLLGKTYAEAGEEEGVQALQDLARHPATARHLATQLARHFIADDPPAAAVAALEREYRDSDGDLGRVTRRLISLPEAWQPAQRKLRSPNDWVTAVFRAVDPQADDRGLKALGVLRQLGQLPMMAPSPAGWPDMLADWLSPEALMARIDLAQLFGRRLGAAIDPRQLAEATVGPILSQDTHVQIVNAPSRAEGLALLLVSPEFMRR